MWGVQTLKLCYSSAIMTISLAVTARDKSIKGEAIRQGGDVPAVVYGPKQTAIAITLPGKEFEKVRKEAGESTIIELTGLEEKLEVLMKDITFSPVKQTITHVDFYAIEKGKDITTDIALEFIGEAPVEDSKKGTVTKVLHEVEVTCKPNLLPSHIDVDISVLKTIEDKIHISDLIVAKGVHINAEADDVVAVVSAAREHTEDEDEAAEVDMDAIEVEAKGKGTKESEEDAK